MFEPLRVLLLKIRPSYNIHGDPCTGKTVSLFWKGPLQCRRYLHRQTRKRRWWLVTAKFDECSTPAAVMQCTKLFTHINNSEFLWYIWRLSLLSTQYLQIAAIAALSKQRSTGCSASTQFFWARPIVRIWFIRYKHSSWYMIILN